MINLSKEMINSITSQYGDAVYIFNKDEFEKNYRELEVLLDRNTVIIISVILIKLTILLQFVNVLKI